MWHLDSESEVCKDLIEDVDECGDDDQEEEITITGMKVTQNNKMNAI